jgi:hypothetical protein
VKNVHANIKKIINKRLQSMQSGTVMKPEQSKRNMHATHAIQQQVSTVKN